MPAQKLVFIPPGLSHSVDVYDARCARIEARKQARREAQKALRDQQQARYRQAREDWLKSLPGLPGRAEGHTVKVTFPEFGTEPREAGDLPRRGDVVRYLVSGEAKQNDPPAREPHLKPEGRPPA